MEDSGTKGGRTRRTSARTPAAATKTPATADKKAAADKEAAADKKAAAVSKTATPKKAPTVRRAAEPKAPVASATMVERDEMVRIAAYFRAERRGFTPGYEIADWLAAQAEVAERVHPATPAKPATAPARKRGG